MHRRKVVLYIAMSLDGYIATVTGEIGFLQIVSRPGEDYGYGEFVKTIDTVIMGRKTYDTVLSFGIPFPHQDKACYVLSRTKQGQDGNVTFFAGDPANLIETIRSSDGLDIFVDGGAETVHELMRRQLIDRFIISVIPVLLGNGIPLFMDGFPEQSLTLSKSASFPSGLVQLWYDRS